MSNRNVPELEWLDALDDSDRDYLLSDDPEIVARRWRHEIQETDDKPDVVLSIIKEAKMNCGSYGLAALDCAITTMERDAADAEPSADTPIELVLLRAIKRHVEQDLHRPLDLLGPSQNEVTMGAGTKPAETFDTDPRPVELAAKFLSYNPGNLSQRIRAVNHDVRNLNKKLRNATEQQLEDLLTDRARALEQADGEELWGQAQLIGLHEAYYYHLFGAARTGLDNEQLAANLESHDWSRKLPIFRMAMEAIANRLPREHHGGDLLDDKIAVIQRRLHYYVIHPIEADTAIVGSAFAQNAADLLRRKDDNLE